MHCYISLIHMIQWILYSIFIAVPAVSEIHPSYRPWPIAYTPRPNVFIANFWPELKVVTLKSTVKASQQEIPLDIIWGWMEDNSIYLTRQLKHIFSWGRAFVLHVCPLCELEMIHKRYHSTPFESITLQKLLLTEKDCMTFVIGKGYLSSMVHYKSLCFSVLYTLQTDSTLGGE